MNKTELVSAVAERANLSKKDSEAAITAALEVITNTLCDGEEVRLMGFGTFAVKNRAARTGRNPRTNEEYQIAASRVPTFKAGKIFKDTVAINR